MLGSVRSLSVCTSQRQWPLRFDVGTEDLLPTTMPKTFGEALRGAGQCGQTGSVGVGISMNKPSIIYICMDGCSSLRSIINTMHVS